MRYNAGIGAHSRYQNVGIAKHHRDVVVSEACRVIRFTAGYGRGPDCFCTAGMPGEVAAVAVIFVCHPAQVVGKPYLLVGDQFAALARRISIGLKNGWVERLIQIALASHRLDLQVGAARIVGMRIVHNAHQRTAALEEETCKSLRKPSIIGIGNAIVAVYCDRLRGHRTPVRTIGAKRDVGIAESNSRLSKGIRALVRLAARCCGKVLTNLRNKHTAYDEQNKQDCDSYDQHLAALRAPGYSGFRPPVVLRHSYRGSLRQLKQAVTGDIITVLRCSFSAGGSVPLSLLAGIIHERLYA